MELTIDFSAHASHDKKRLVISFLNALARSSMITGADTRYTFEFRREAKLAKARETLTEWEREGLLRWREAD